MRIIYTIIFGIFFSGITYGQSHSSSDRYTNAYKKYLDASCPLEQDSILHFVYFARDRELIHEHPFLKIERFTGAQIMYPWKELEPEMGKYDFSAIREDYEYLLSCGKKLFIQLQDATFSTVFKGVPDYLLTEEFDGGVVAQYNDNGKVEGWVAKRWNPAVQHRFALLLKALGKEFDGKVEGINLQESAIGVNNEIDSAFTPERYTESLKINMLAMKKAFPSSATMQYANFMPGEWLPDNDKGYLRSIYEYGEEIGVGLGGPDLMIKRKGQLNHTIAMMHEGTFTVPLGIAIQDGNYIEQTGNSIAVSNRANIVPLLHAFAKDFLKVRYMFWVCEEPYFTEDVIPCFRPQSPAEVLTEKRFITVDGVRIFINTMRLENRKEGQPVVVFQSGMGTPMGNWDPILEKVSEMAPLITYDRPGIGQSEPDSVMPTIKNVSDFMIKILQHLRVDPPYLLVGHSLGGVYVRGFARYYPEMLAGLIIIDPGDFTETQENKRQYYTDIGFSDPGIDSLFRKFELENAEKVQNSSVPVSFQNEMAVLGELRKTDFREITDSPLPDIPVHIITSGRYDTPLRLRRPEYNDSLLFRSKMIHRSTRWISVIQSVGKGMYFYSADAGHFVHRDDPELVISSIRIALEDFYLLRSEKTHRQIKTISGKEISVSEMDEFLSEQMDSAGMPGLSIAVINDAEIVYSRTAGVVNADTGEEVSAETVFDAGSMSKPAFTYLVMKMADQGLLDIDQPLYTYLPYPDIEHDERYKLITARMVLCHTSGFPNWRFLNSDSKLDIKFTPGTQFLYSGEGFEYLANVIAHIKGIPKNDLQYLYEEEVSKPLGMKYAYFTWNDYVAEHQAAGHVDGKVAEGWGINAGKPDFAAAYSLQTEAISYAKLIIAIMQEQGLQKETFNEMLKPRIQIPSDTDSSSYCLGIRMMSTRIGNLYFHDGYNLNFYSAFMFNKDSKSGYVFFTNCNNGSGFNKKLEAFMTCDR